MTESESRASVTDETDVVVVGGGPAGCSAAVFTARYGLDTVVFDRGNAALPRCAYLENYLGFPAGMDVDAFRDLMHAHVEEVGATLLADMVVAVERAEDTSGFVVETQDGRRVGAESVIAAAWYDGSYLRGLDDEDEMFHEHEHHGELEEHFDPAYADADGRTPVDGLYVASPAGGRSAQAIVAAGNGAHVARSLIEDERRARGLSGEVAPEYDWLRSESEFTGEWAERDRWREWFENEFDADGVDDERRRELRERYIDRAFETKVGDEEADRRFESGLARFVAVVGRDRVLDAIGTDRVVEALDDQTLLEELDDETIAEYLEKSADEPDAS
ncbi:FAD-dependent oxidoreductase [Haloarchaeobius amylolyticus]|uniref:FAD-dependent oxidoreductase n=1 Tax=Haloarchaeobius amylolyticus TaxID=1198296 RepID=UPI002271F01C|nr:FAD-dependent oxidoreductase [Haloarchaeobius amylolyticus]